MFPAAAYAAEDGDIYHSTINTDWEEDIYCVVKTDGTLYKIPHTENTVEVSLNEMISTQVTDNVISCEGSYVLKEDGTVWEFDETTGGFDKITDDVKEIACGGSHALFVKNDNTLWGVGDNSCGQLAQGEMDKPLEEQIQEDLKYKNETKCAPEKIEEPVKIMENVKSAAAYGTVSVVLKTDGTVWTFGADTGGGALGIGGRWLVNNEPTQILSNIKDIFVQGEAGFAVDNDDTLWRWGSNYAGYAGGNPYDRLTPEKYMENVKYASNMSGYNLIIKTDNSLWIYGDTDADNGDIGYSSSEEPFKLADDAVCALGLNEYFLTEYENDRILVLQTNGDLMLYAIPMLEDKEPYLIGKVTGNVRLPNEIPASINFTDITDKSDEAQKAVNALTRAGII
ncbi:MAG: hypothetical protein LUF26_04270, partial [Firmicutes bacterium]|nr:hypothetical protein [Bacillota bacterium]